MVLADSSPPKLVPQSSLPASSAVTAEPSLEDFRYLSPAEFEALMPDLTLLESLSFEEFKALMPDANYLYSDEPETESSLHYSQLALLMTCLEFIWGDRDDFFIAANLTIYYSLEQIKTRDFRGPDFFFVKDVVRSERASWVIWEERDRFPNVIIELLSESTASMDRNAKKTLYSQRFKTPEYFWFGPKTLEFKGFKLVNGQYEAIPPNLQGHLWSEELGLFLGIADRKLRYFDSDGQMILTPSEVARQEIARGEQALLIASEYRLRAEQERSRAEEQSLRADRLAEHLRSIGIDPNLVV
jgi:Uma2 family endonuclease